MAPRLCWAAMLAVSLNAAVALADDEPTSASIDLEGRVQYAFFTEDVRALQDVARQANAAEADALTRYFSALADYRRAQIVAEKQPSVAKEAADRCADTAKQVEEQDPKWVEAKTLRAACAGVVAVVTRVTAPLAGSSSANHLRRALRSAPKNPRVRLIELALEFDRVTTDKATRGRLVDRCRDVVALFEAERRGAVRVPSWGAAEAYVYLGRALLDQGNAVGAREAFEQALLVAPEYSTARRWAARITSRG